MPGRGANLKGPGVKHHRKDKQHKQESYSRRGSVVLWSVIVGWELCPYCAIYAYISHVKKYIYLSK